MQYSTDISFFRGWGWGDEGEGGSLLEQSSFSDFDISMETKLLLITSHMTVIQRYLKKIVYIKILYNYVDTSERKSLDSKNFRCTFRFSLNAHGFDLQGHQAKQADL